MTTYRQKLLDPRWQRRRLERLQLSNFKCDLCHDGESTLHVHHRRYTKGADPWEYSDHELSVLCENCHAEEHYHESIAASAMVAVPHSLLNSKNISCLIVGYCIGLIPQRGTKYPVIRDFYINLIRKISDEGEKDEFFLNGLMAGAGFPGVSFRDAQHCKVELP